MEETDLIILWGSNARDAHPIFFHHILKGIHNGAKMYAIDPRRTASAEWADVWLGLNVGADIALANAVGREIISAGLADQKFIARATSQFDEYAESVDSYTLDFAADVAGVPADLIWSLAHDYGKAETAQLCWTLGITEHHNAVDNVSALINLALLTGHVGRYGSGLNPIRGQNNVQGGGDMGAIPNKLPGFQDVEDDELRGKFEARWGVEIPSEKGWHLSQMFDAMGRAELRALYVVGENPAQSEAEVEHARSLLQGLDHMVVQDIFMTRTAEMADVVLPAAADWCEAEGTVTSSERRVQRVRKALDPPGEARDDLSIICDLAGHMGRDIGSPTAEEAWDELRDLSPMHAGMSYRRLEELGGIQWPCYDEEHPGELFLHSRLWNDPIEGPPAPFSVTPYVPPLDALGDGYPIRLTTGRRLDSFNTGVQSSGYVSPLRNPEALCLSPEDAAKIGLEEGERVLVSSRRGGIEAPIHIDQSLTPGLAFMTLHSPDDVDINVLTSEVWDPKSGTAEFKATAIRVEKLAAKV